jgi:hypothetical protein
MCCGTGYLWQDVVFGKSFCHFHANTTLYQDVPEPTREQIEADVDAKLVEPNVQQFIRNSSLLFLGVTSQPGRYEKEHKLKGGIRFLPLITFPSKLSGGHAHRYLVVRGLVDDFIRPKVINCEEVATTSRTRFQRHNEIGNRRQFFFKCAIKHGIHHLSN